MVDWTKTFKAEYDYARAYVANEADFASEWQPLLRDLRRLMGTEGFGAGHAGALTELRRKATKGEGSKKISEDEAILKAVGGWTDDGTGSVEPQRKMRAAALKLLRHVYLLNRSGARKTRVVSLPSTLHDWPSDDFNARASTQGAARNLLRSSNEIFNEEHKKHLAHTSQHALAWCQQGSQRQAWRGGCKGPGRVRHS